jgi:hypothetical protein
MVLSRTTEGRGIFAFHTTALRSHCWFVGEFTHEEKCKQTNPERKSETARPRQPRESLLGLLAGTLYSIREVIVALSSVHNEASDSRFMDLGTPPEIRGIIRPEDI